MGRSKHFNIDVRSPIVAINTAHTARYSAADRGVLLKMA